MSQKMNLLTHRSGLAQALPTILAWPDDVVAPQSGYDIQEVIVNKDVVMVYLKDGRKGVAKLSKNDTFDFEIGFTLAYFYAKNVSSKTRWHQVVKKWQKKVKK